MPCHVQMHPGGVAPFLLVNIEESPELRLPAKGSYAQMYASSSWAKDSWRSKPALQIPMYPNQRSWSRCSKARTLRWCSPVGEKTGGQTRGRCRWKEAFLLQGGDCAESSMEFNAINKGILSAFCCRQMAVVLAFGAGMPIIKVGRMAGLRSEPFETKDDIKLQSYQGDNINSDSFNDEARAFDPKRFQDYSQSVRTLNLLRAFAHGGYVSIHRVIQWNFDFVQHSEQGDRLSIFSIYY